MEWTKNKNTQTQKYSPKTLVEDTLGFSISDLGRYLCKKEKTDFLKLRGNKLRYQIFKKDGSWKLSISWIENLDIISTQQVLIKTIPVTFGLRPYFICPLCRTMTCNLYYDRNKKLGCRTCRNLAYRSSRNNHEMPLNRLFRRYEKVIETASTVKRVVYNNQYTRNAKAVMRMAKKWLTIDQKHQVNDYVERTLLKSHRI